MKVFPPTFNWITSFLRFGGGSENLQRSEQAHFLAASPLTRAPASLALNIRSLPLASVLPNVSLLASYI